MESELAAAPAVKWQVGQVLKSIEHQGGRVSLHFRHQDLEIMVVEVEGGSSLVDASLWGRPSWHFVLQGQAAFHLGNARWELLPEESVTVDSPSPYTIVNLSPERLRLLSVVRGGSPEGEGR